MAKNTFLAIGLVLLFGCASYVITPELVKRSEAIPFRELLRNPNLYKGKTVILSGVILECKAVFDGTLCEVLQIPVRPGMRPDSADRSEGRFMAHSRQFLDPVVYSRGRQVTLGGVVSGEHRKMVDEREYRYPLIEVEEIYLWPAEKEVPSYPCSPWCCDFGWSYRRCCGPWWWCWP